MARNEEKALNLFNKWQTFKKDFHSREGNRRPLLASDCDSLADAESFRRDLVRDITRKVAAIQNAGLGEQRLREMNDEINKLMRSKKFWETRIGELGGTVSGAKQFYEVDGRELPNAPGYWYYGAAKNLPGVRELLAEKDEEREKRKLKRTRGDLYKNVTADYFGHRDDEDQKLEDALKRVEKHLLETSHRQFQEKRQELVQKAKSQVLLQDDEVKYLQDSSDEEDLTQLLDKHQVQSIRQRSALSVAQSVLLSQTAQDASLNPAGAATAGNSSATSQAGGADNAVSQADLAEVNSILLDQRKQALLQQLF